MNSLQDYITGARERRNNEALAARIFTTRDRRQSAPLSQSRIGSLASRVGVKKPRIPTGPRLANSYSINGEWTHDLYNQSDDPDASTSRARPSASSRVSSSRPRDPAAYRRANLARGLERAVSDSRVSSQLHLIDGKQPPLGPRAQQTTATQRKQQPAAQKRDLVDETDDDGEDEASPTQAQVQGISIRGLAGPYTVMVQNLAPGTSTADIESAMMPIGGEMLSCKITKTSPIMVVEMVFVSKVGADAVVEAFNNKTADGRIIRVYHKVGGFTPNPQTQTQVQPQTQSQPQPPAQVPQPVLEVATPSHTDSWQRDQPDARQAPIVDAPVAIPTGPRDSRRGRYSDDDEAMDDRDAPRPNHGAGREWGWDNDRSGGRNGGGGGGGVGGYGRPSNGRFRHDDAGSNNYRRGWGYDTRPDHSRGYRR